MPRREKGQCRAIADRLKEEIIPVFNDWGFTSVIADAPLRAKERPRRAFYGYDGGMYVWDFHDISRSNEHRVLSLTLGCSAFGLNVHFARLTPGMLTTGPSSSVKTTECTAIEVCDARQKGLTRKHTLFTLFDISYRAPSASDRLDAFLHGLRGDLNIVRDYFENGKPSRQIISFYSGRQRARG